MFAGLMTVVAGIVALLLLVYLVVARSSRSGSDEPGSGGWSMYRWVTTWRGSSPREPDPAHPRHLLTEAGVGYRFRS